MKKDTKKYLSQMANASAIGIQLVLSTFIGLFFGVMLDRKLNTFPWLALVFLVLGVAAGFLNYYRFIRKQQKEEEEG